ncbi:MAG: hypothetical protein GWN00_24145, partial [Aliifodinibius sp.]|nr:hypothetical protein [Fodinibius sp.]NIV13980.1 hypothetical protein [Fodinibius sp.]NIY27779.1 hypothetical protein [Fodinibius sp.]
MFKNLLNMYLTITISLFILFTFHSLRAQNIDNVLGGSTANEGFFIINSNGDTVFTTRAHGKSGIGTTNPANLFEVVVPYSVIIGKEGIAGSTYSFGEIENSFNPSSPNGGAGIQVTDLSGMGKVGMTMELFGGQFGLVGNGGSVILQPSASNFNSQDYDLTIGPDIVHSSNLMVSGRKGVCFTGAYNSGQSPPLEGAGNRMMWYPNKAAFRVGGVDATEWDDGNIGWYSVATGYRTLARGNYSIAMGYGTTARGYASTAMGLSTVANGYASTAMGQGTQASGNHSTALGYGTIASGSGATAIGAGSNASGNASTAMGNGTVAEGLGSTAMGYRTIASADYSTGIGWFTNASGDYSISIGSTTEASGDYSTAMGNNVEISGEGSFIIGDHAVNRMVRSTPNRFFARFKNGYALYTN